MKNKKLVSKEG